MDGPLTMDLLSPLFGRIEFHVLVYSFRVEWLSVKGKGGFVLHATHHAHSTSLNGDCAPFIYLAYL